jgi:hypothetical protein
MAQQCEAGGKAPQQGGGKRAPDMPLIPRCGNDVDIGEGQAGALEGSAKRAVWKGESVLLAGMAFFLEDEARPAILQQCQTRIMGLTDETQYPFCHVVSFVGLWWKRSSTARQSAGRSCRLIADARSCDRIADCALCWSGSPIKTRSRNAQITRFDVSFGFFSVER